MDKINIELEKFKAFWSILLKYLPNVFLMCLSLFFQGGGHYGFFIGTIVLCCFYIVFSLAFLYISDFRSFWALLTDKVIIVEDEVAYSKSYKDVTTYSFFAEQEDAKTTYRGRKVFFDKTPYTYRTHMFNPLHHGDKVVLFITDNNEYPKVIHAVKIGEKTY